MPVILSDVIRRVRSILDEATANFYTDTQITDWINDGARDLARKSEDLLTFSTAIAVLAGTAKYTLPTDVIRLHRAEFVPTGQTQIYPVQASTHQELDLVWGVNQAIQSSYPSYFVTNGYPGGVGSSLFQVQLYPVPAQTGTLNIFYYRLPYRFLDPIANPAELVKTVEVVEGWDDLIVHYAEWNALRRDREDRWAEAKALYDSELDYLLNVTRNYHDQSQMMTNAMRTNVPGWLYEFD